MIVEGDETGRLVVSEDEWGEVADYIHGHVMPFGGESVLVVDRMEINAADASVVVTADGGELRIRERSDNGAFEESGSE